MNRFRKSEFDIRLSQGRLLCRVFCRSVLLSALVAGAALPACKGESAGPESERTAPGVTAAEPPEEKPVDFPKQPLSVGQSVFNFTALAHTGQSLRLSDYLRRPVVVYFCPGDAQPLCTALATSVRDVWADLHSQVDMVYGVSPEPTIIHREFAADNLLTHLMLSDSDNIVHRVFGVQTGMVLGYLVDTDRTIIHTFSPPNAAAFGAEILTVLTAKGLKRPDFPI